MASVRERARQIEKTEASNLLAFQYPESKIPAPSRRLIEIAETERPGSPICLPYRSQTSKSIFDFEGIALEEPRPLLVPQIKGNLGEPRRASDGGAIPTIQTDRLAASSSRLRRTKSSADGLRRVPAPISVANIPPPKEFMASDFQTEHSIVGQKTQYDLYGPKTACPVQISAGEDSSSLFKSFQGFLAAPKSPNPAAIGRNIAGTLSPLLSSARETFEQAGSGVRQLGVNIKEAMGDNGRVELNLMSPMGIIVQS